MAKVIPAIAILEHTRIEKRDISSKISEVLKDKKIYHLYYWYRAGEILNKSNIQHTKETAELIKKQILKNPWNREYTDEEIYSKVFKQIYGSNIDDLKNKEFILLVTKEFFETISNKKGGKDEKLDYILVREYNGLMKKIALSILINIGHLSPNTNPMGSLKSILTTENPHTLNTGDLKNTASLILKLRNARDPISKYLRNKFSNGMVQLLDKSDMSAYPSKAVQNALVSELNRIITCNALYDIQCFKQIYMLVDQNPSNYDIIHINRLLLEEAYPHEIAKRVQVNEFVKKIKSQKSFDEFRGAINYAARLIENTNNNIDVEIKFSEVESNLKKFILFYEQLFE